MTDLDSQDVADSQEREFHSVRELFRKLVADPETQRLMEEELNPNSRMVYTNTATLWMLILQRLGGGQSLQKVVQQVIAQETSLFPDGKRVRDGSLSRNTSAYAKARLRLPLDVIEKFSRHCCDYIGQSTTPYLPGSRVFVLDGTTITLAPTPALQKAYPPATNQYGKTPWPIALLFFANELTTGCALLPKLAPMNGPENSSEAKMLCEIVRDLPANSVVLADANFGIFATAKACSDNQLPFLFRLSQARFKRIIKGGELIAEGANFRTYQIVWHPSDRVVKNNKNVKADDQLTVTVHDVRLDNGEKLRLVTDMNLSLQEAVELYGRRYDIEHNIRDIKVTLDTENIRAKSVEMFQKELWTSIVAYNLATQFRRLAAELANVPPRRLSFTQVWTAFQLDLLNKERSTFAEWEALFERALVVASKFKLPNRRKPRSYPRISYQRRAKSTKFQKEQRRKKKKTDPEEDKVE